GASPRSGRQAPGRPSRPLDVRSALRALGLGELTTMKGGRLLLLRRLGLGRSDNRSALASAQRFATEQLGHTAYAVLAHDNVRADGALHVVAVGDDVRRLAVALLSWITDAPAPAVRVVGVGVRDDELLIGHGFS